MQDAKLLIVDDDPDVLLAARLLLKRHVATVDIEKNPEKLPFLLNNNRYDAIVLDMNFQRDVSSGREGFAWLDRILWTSTRPRGWCCSRPMATLKWPFGP